MKGLIIPCLFVTNALVGQVFMQPFENAANLSMGGATVALDGPINGLTNAAQLGKSPKLGVFAYSALPYSLTGWQSNGFQAIGKLQRRSGVGIEVLHSGIEGYAEQRLQLSYGRQLSEKLSLGGSLLGMRVSANEYGSRSILSFSVGVMAQPLPRLTIAAVVQNPLPQRIAEASVANVLRIGAAWKASDLFLVSSEVTKDLNKPFQIKTGVEYRPTDVVRLRIGMRTYPSRAALGAGFVIKNGLRLDFGSEWHPVLGFTPAAMVAWTRR